jgi:SpoVK/Ycf46/Vps4 family AAA+-type ATPase
MFFVDLPDKEERHDIIKMYIEKYLKLQVPDNLLTELVRITEGFSGADLEASIRDISYKLIADPEYKLTGQAIIDSIKKVVPMAKTNPEKIEFIRNWGKERAVPASNIKQV